MTDTCKHCGGPLSSVLPTWIYQHNPGCQYFAKQQREMLMYEVKARDATHQADHGGKMSICESQYGVICVCGSLQEYCTACNMCPGCPDWHHRPCAQGRKDDGDKPRYDLIPPSTLHALASVLTFGAAKYAPRNWEKGIAWGRVFAALMRHLWAWWRGEHTDPETGFSHLWHAQCCITFLIEFEATHPELDDRPGKEAK